MMTKFEWQTFHYAIDGAYLSCPPYLGIVFPKNGDGVFDWKVVRYNGRKIAGFTESLSESKMAVEGVIKGSSL